MTSPARKFQAMALVLSWAAVSFSAVASQAWYGDLHVHTGYSSDAYIFNVRVTPDDAYRYAKGEEIEHASGALLQAGRPFDFIAVTDHAEYLGILNAMGNTAHPLSKSGLAGEFISQDRSRVVEAFSRLSASIIAASPIPELNDQGVFDATWRDIVEAADRHNRPGEFTALAGYEWSASPLNDAIHRNVIFSGGWGEVPIHPFSALDSSKPEDLWDYMDKARRTGSDVLAIPHNSNMSNGRMFPRVETMNAGLARQRERNEPLVEITQVKGTSETHPQLSPGDEWSSFALYQYRMGTEDGRAAPEGSYVRDALRIGLQLKESSGVNPYKVGFIGSSDSHNGNVAIEESAFSGKVGLLDGTVEVRRAQGFSHIWSASGLAAVWAEENTRESIFEALRRREVFATTGTRIQLRFFAGWSFPDDMANRSDAIQLASRHGSPMGATLSPGPGNTAPEFFVSSLQDPLAAPLERLQIVKGWTRDGMSYERVEDIACADGVQPSIDTKRCPDTNTAVNLETCTFNGEAGDSNLTALWRDSDFDPGENAFYYVRVLEVPSCHWSTWDAVNNGLELLEDAPHTIQERAWSSPIWYGPDR